VFWKMSLHVSTLLQFVTTQKITMNTKVFAEYNFGSYRSHINPTLHEN
jgi:hypothetical protein